MPALLLLLSGDMSGTQTGAAKKQVALEHTGGGVGGGLMMSRVAAMDKLDACRTYKQTHVALACPCCAAGLLKQELRTVYASINLPMVHHGSYGVTPLTNVI